jgi:hypothetical protein
MRIEIGRLTLSFTGLPGQGAPVVPAGAVARKDSAAAAPGTRQPYGRAGLEAEALANEKLVQAGRMATVAVNGRGPMLQRRGAAGGEPPTIAERIAAYLTTQAGGDLRVRLPVMSTAELTELVRKSVSGADLLRDSALQKIIDDWRAARTPSLTPPGRGAASPAGGLPGVGPPPAGPSPLGGRLGDFGRLLSRIPTSVALGDPRAVELTAGRSGLQLSHERPGLKLSAGIGWDRVLGAEAAAGDLKFTAAADVLGGEGQKLTFGLQYGPDAPALATLPRTFQPAGQAAGHALVNLPRFASYLREGGVDELKAIPDAAEQVRRIAGERDRKIPVTFGLSAEVNRGPQGPPGVSVLGNLTFAWDVLKKAQAGADPASPQSVAIPRDGGKPLGAAVAKRLEGFFGRRLPDVRLHTGPAAASAATQLGAEAFTIGRDIYFGAGKYNPDSQQGLGLLGHELTHVLQQNGDQRNKVQRAGGGDTGLLESQARGAAKAIVSASNGARNGTLSIGEYRPSYRSADGQALTDAEQAMLANIAARGREVCEQILRAEHPSVLGADRALPRLRMKLEVHLDGLSPERAAHAWGRKMAETIVSAIQAIEAEHSLASAPAGAPQLSPNGQAPAAPAVVMAAPAAPATPATPGAAAPPAGPGVAPAVATPGARPVDPPEVLNALKAEAKADALKIKELLHSGLKDAPMWEMGKRMVEGKKAAWDIIMKWAAKPLDAGYQGRGGYMTPFDFFVSALQTQTFTVEEWFVEQWTNAFEIICERMGDANVAMFKMWVQTRSRLFKDEKPRGLVHFDAAGVVLEAGEVALELGAATLTGGGSLVAKIVHWLAFKLPKLIDQAKAVYHFVDKIRGLDFDDVKKFFNAVGLGRILAGALFGKAAALPTAGAGEEEAKDQEAGSSSEAGGFIALLREVMTVINAVKRSYNKVAETVNAVVASLDITKAKWFEPFSMAYAGVVHAVKAMSNPGATLHHASQTLREIVGGFFKTLKDKIAEVASDVKGYLKLVGNGPKLIAELADKAVEMVVNFLIKHNPSAAIKAAFRVIEEAADQPIVQLLRNKVPYGDEIFKKISESDIVRRLLRPLEKPVSAVSEMTEAAAGEATRLVTKVEQEALGVVADGVTMVSELAGVKAPQAAASETAADAAAPANAAAAGGGGGASTFLGALKQGVHASLLELGTASLIRHGKQLGKAAVEKGKELGKAAVEKGTAAAKGLAARLFGPKIPFKVGREEHELWVEERRNDAVVLVKSEEVELDAKIASFDSAIAAMPDSPRKLTAVADVGGLRTSYRALKDSWATARENVPEVPLTRPEPLAPGVTVRSKRDIGRVERRIAREKRRIVDELKRLLLLHGPAAGDFVLDLNTVGVSAQARNRAGGALSLNYMVGRIKGIDRRTGWRPVYEGIEREDDEGLINLGSEYGLQEYVRYHMHGPGLGQEHYPIPLAPTAANEFANHHVEGFMRTRRNAGATVAFKMTYGTYSGAELRAFVESMLRSGNTDIISRLALDQGRIETFLKSVTYEIRVSENRMISFYQATIAMNPPVMGQITNVMTAAPSLTRQARANA